MATDEKIEEVLLRMTDWEIQNGLREVNAEELAGFMRVTHDDRVKSRILANMSMRAAKLLQEMVVRDEGEKIETDRDRKERVAAAMRGAAQSSAPEPPVIESYETGSVSQLIDLIGKLASKARWNLLSLSEDADRISDRLLRDGLRIISEAASYNALRVEELLDVLAERHMTEQQLTCKIIRAGLMEIFDSTNEQRLRQRLRAMVPFLDEHGIG